MKKGLGIAAAVVLGMVVAGWIFRDQQPTTEQQLDTALGSMPVSRSAVRVPFRNFSRTSVLTSLPVSAV